MVRAPFFDKNGQKKGAWSQEEDDKLRAYVQKYGHWNWRELPKFAGLSRCGKSCRLRWMNYLRPGVKHGNFSEEEEDLIIELHKQFGNKWSKIAAKLPGRTDNEIKNSWHTHLKWRTKKGESSSGFQEKRSSNVKVESSPANNIPFPTIFESFQLPPESSSTTEFSHLTCDSATVSKSSNWIAEVESSLANNIPFPPIFESFQLPPESSSTTEFSHLTCDSAMVNKSSNWIAEVESSLANNIPFPPLFESFQLSPESSSTTEFSHLTCDSAMVSTSSNWIAEDSHALSETFEYCGEDFWTQPFVAEKDAHRLPLPQEGLVSSYFTSYYEDDAIDLFYQVTKELPGNFS